MSIQSEIERLTQAKQEIRQAIQDKGVEVPEGTPFRQYAGKIGEIPAMTQEQADARYLQLTGGTMAEGAMIAGTKGLGLGVKNASGKVSSVLLQEDTVVIAASDTAQGGGPGPGNMGALSLGTDSVAILLNNGNGMGQVSVGPNAVQIVTGTGLGLAIDENIRFYAPVAAPNAADEGQLATLRQVNALVGSINAALDAINGEVV